jgi:hypothetical protein
MPKLPRIGVAKLISFVVNLVAKNPIKASTASFDEALNDTMPDEVQFRFDFDPGVPWDAAS